MKIRSLLYIILFAVVGGSCTKDKEYLEKAIPSIWSASEPNTNSELESLLGGTYFSLMGNFLTGSPFDGIVSYPTLASGECTWQTIAGTYQNMDHWNTRKNSSTDIQSLQYWSSCYYVIHQCNIILSKVGKFTDNKNWEARIEGEARFLKAICNYSLVTGFGSPYGSNNSAKASILYDVNNMSKGPADLRTRSTVEEVYSAVIADLKIAIEKLPVKYSEGSDPSTYKLRTRAWKSAAQMALCRVYFNMGKDHWNEALLLINDVIASSDPKFALVSNPQDAFNLLHMQPSSNETIWSFSCGWWTWHNAPFIWMTSGDIFNANPRTPARAFTISDEMLSYIGWDNEAIAKQDSRYVKCFHRFEAKRDTIPSYKSINKTCVWPVKYEISFRSEISLMRLAELYLDKAIILFKNGDKSGAATALKVIRDRAGLPEIIAASITAEDIHKERAKELLFEGDWLHYLQCQKMEIPSGTIGGSKIPWNDPSLVLPVPADELAANPGI